MQYNYKKLHERIIEKYGTQTAFSKALGVSKALMSMKLSCKVAISREDIVKWSQLLDIKPSEYAEYFFT